MLGPRCEFTDGFLDEHARRLEGMGNMDVVPDPTTLHSVSWGGFGKYRVGEVLCDLRQKDGQPLTACPRYAAKKQLEHLDTMGLRFLSSYELEFILMDRKSEQPVFDGNDVLSNLIVGDSERFLYQVDQDMLKAGVDIEMIQSECCPGQFEITMVPIYGIEGADKTLILKQGIKEIAHQQGFEASFMSKSSMADNGNGAHFNFSLWSKVDGSNALYDPDGEDRLSDTARHWIGGLLEHGAALSAFLCPTVNCYRRLHCPWAPSPINWGVDDRTVSLRVKNDGPQSTYIENRVPSGSSNPYLVLAATLAAGLDGVANKIDPASMKGRSSPKLPKTLEEALTALENDHVFVKSLGEDLVSWFTTLKRQVDLTILENSDVTVDDPKALAAEKRMYSVTM